MVLDLFKVGCPMLKEQRFEAICDELKKNGIISIDDLAKRLNISRSTIRRDIFELESNAALKRIRGGAVAVHSSTSYEPTFYERADVSRDEKRRIAAAAASLIKPNETLLLAGGTTIHEFAKQLRNISPLYVATVDLMSAVELAKYPNVELTILGGTVRRSHYSVIGYFAESMIRQIHADRAFLNADAVDFNIGTMNFSAEEIAVNKLIIEASNQVIVLCDHTKFDAIAFANTCSFDKIDLLITGREIREDYLDRLHEIGVEVMVV